MSFISSFEIIKVVVPEPSIFFFFWIPASVSDAAAVNPNGIKTLLANGLITFFIVGNPVFNNGPRSLPRNHPDLIILDISALLSFIPVGILFSIAFLSLVVCLIVSNNS